MPFATCSSCTSLDGSRRGLRHRSDGHRSTSIVWWLAAMSTPCERALELCAPHLTPFTRQEPLLIVGFHSTGISPLLGLLQASKFPTFKLYLSQPSLDSVRSFAGLRRGMAATLSEIHICADWTKARDRPQRCITCNKVCQLPTQSFDMGLFHFGKGKQQDAAKWMRDHLAAFRPKLLTFIGR